VVTPDGRTALITNFGYQAVYFVDVTNPISPAVITSVTLPLQAEDIALTHDGRFAVVTDGGTDSPIVSVDVLSQTLAYTLSLPALNAQAVEIAPDGTVIVADFFNGALYSLLIDAAGALTVTGMYTYTLTPDGRLDGEIVPHPTNIGVAPDGQTVLVCDGYAYNVPVNTRFEASVYRITAPGVLSFTSVITGLTRAPQSVAFSPTGDEAYLHGNSGNAFLNDTDELAVLSIDGPGQVSLKTNGAADLVRMTDGQLYGVDTLATANGKAYAGYPMSFIDWSVPNFIAIVDLSNGTTITRQVSDLPMGVAVIPAQTPEPPVFKLWLPIVLQ
jgi:DNA-binding beta-propeller fold protein YncE